MDGIACIAGHDGPTDSGRGLRRRLCRGLLAIVVVLAAPAAGSRDEESVGSLISQPLQGHTGAVEQIAIGKLGGRAIAVSASSDKTIRVWDLGGG